uniref:CCHC-type domain-containing protein n=1 Tax=Rhipicephalus microplus TaxID=6941 RepID=A0A6G5AD13_RHIMP
MRQETVLLRLLLTAHHNQNLSKFFAFHCLLSHSRKLVSACSVCFYLPFSLGLFRALLWYHFDVKEELNKPSTGDPDDVQLESSVIKSRKSGNISTKRQKCSKSFNENFIRINLKKKKFSRGHHKVNVRQLKYKEWKKKHTFSERTSCKSATSKCFKCGELGHWARSCSTNSSKLKIPEEPEVAHLPTLEEAAQMARGIKSSNISETSTKVFSSKDSSQQQDEVGTIMNESEIRDHAADMKGNERINVQPLLKADLDGKLPDTPEFVFEALHKMGFSEFRPGQEATIKEFYAVCQHCWCLQLAQESLCATNFQHICMHKNPTA